MEKFKREMLGLNEFVEIPDGIMQGVVISHPATTSEMLTMIGYKRLTNIEEIIKDIVAKKIKGDVIETGVWRGGACIFMRKLLNELNSKKIVYVADSFEGLPKPDEKYIHDKGDTHYSVPVLAVSLEEVQSNFERYGLLENVTFLKGWFKDTLPTLKNEFSFIRLDGDMYESTINALDNLYPKLSIGGYCIIDDYGIVKGCNHAVTDYRNTHGITDELIPIDGSGVYWKKTK